MTFKDLKITYQNFSLNDNTKLDILKNNHSGYGIKKSTLDKQKKLINNVVSTYCKMSY